MKHDLVVPESSKRMGIMPILLIVENPIFPGYGNLERLLPDKVMPDFSHQPVCDCLGDSEMAGQVLAAVDNVADIGP